MLGASLASTGVDGAVCQRPWAHYATISWYARALTQRRSLLALMNLEQKPVAVSDGALFTD